MNKVTLIGRLTSDTNLKYTEGKGTAMCKFSLAVDRKIKNAEGKREADFINCIAWGKTAEILAEHVTKGKKIAIEGHIQTGNYTNKDNVKVYTTDVILESLEILEWSNSNQQQSSTNMDTTEAELRAMGVDTVVDDGDIPF